MERQDNLLILVILLFIVLFAFAFGYLLYTFKIFRIVVGILALLFSVFILINLYTERRKQWWEKTMLHDKRTGKNLK
ncbi:hypothetical protein LCGC14_0374210 [marine sediment metagenome]|uniref:Uncharacterized protein n=1 Tax=marine sediment metagenome TaxID=412755 RepID=A0A0F9VRC8_9ZZZZ